MAIQLEKFTRQLADAGLVSSQDIQTLLASLPAEQQPKDAEQLARLLILERKLTAFQAQQVYAGKGKGLVLGNYVVLDKLGQGGMGMVLKAEHRRMKRLVALKVLSPGVMETTNALRRFQREVEAAAKLNHPNIVTAYDADEAGGRHFLVMEYAEGIDLSRLVKQNGRLPVERAWSCVLQAARGLEYAHRRGVVHRDIKPSNLLLDDAGTVKILDMGLARLDTAGPQQDQLTGTGQLMGTVDFMAPEQAMDTRRADARADIYSLGVTLWYLLTGRSLYEGDSSVMKLMAHQTKAIPSLRECCPAVSETLDAVFIRMVAKTPESRYQTMADVIADLERCRPGDASTPWAPTGSNEDTLVYDLPRGAAAQPTLAVATQAGPESVALAPALEATVALHSPQADTDPKTEQSLASPMARRPDGKQKARSRWRVQVLVAGGVGAAALVLVGIVLYWQTGQGTEGIGINDEANAVVIDGPGTQAVNDVLPEPSMSFALEMLTSSDWEWTKPENLGPAVNSAGPEMSPHFSADGKRLWFERGLDAKKDRAWIAERETPDKPWNPAKSIGTAFEFSGPMADLFISRDEQTWMFVTWTSKNFAQQLHESTRPSPQADWSPPKLLAAAGSPAQFPVLSNDGLTLFLTNGQQGDGLYSLSRPDTNAPWSEPIRVPGPLNNSEGVRATWLSKDGRVLAFHSVHGHGGGPTEFNLWLTTRPATAEPWQEPVSFGPIINSSATELGACLSDDGRELIFASDRSGGSGDFDLYVSRRVRKVKRQSPSELLASPDYEWSPLEDVAGLNGKAAGPCITADDMSLWFHAREDRTTGDGRLILWHAWRHQQDEPFGQPTEVESSINDLPEFNLSDVTLSADGLVLCFCRSQPREDADLWLSTRPSRDASWPAPVTAGTNVNSEFGEWEPELSADGLELFFHSDCAGGQGGTDLWVSRRSSRGEPFGPAEDLGPEVNSSDDEGGVALSSDGLTLLFHRLSADSPGTPTHWQVARTAVGKPFGSPRPLIVRGLTEASGMSLSLSSAADRLYVTTHQEGSTLTLSMTRRVRKLATAP